MRESTKTPYVKASVVESNLYGLVMTVKKKLPQCAVFTQRWWKGQPTRIKNRKAPDFGVFFWWHRSSWFQKIRGILKYTMTLQCSWTAKISRLTHPSWKALIDEGLNIRQPISILDVVTKSRKQLLQTALKNHRGRGRNKGSDRKPSCS